MARKNIFRFLLTLLLGVAFYRADAQVLDHNDPIVNYDSNNPPSTPPRGEIGKWVRTKRVNWDTQDFKSYYYNGMAFRIRFPENYDPSGNTKYPMLIMFHGRGERGSVYDNEKSLVHAARLHEDDIKRGKYNGFLLYPQNTGGYWGDPHFSVVSDLINNHFDQINVNKNEIVVHGLSAGGAGVWNYISRYPKLVAAALPMSAASPNFYDEINGYKHIPIWLSQGGKDGSPTPYTSRALVEEIEKEGGNIRYTVYHNLGHGVWNTHYRESDFWPFIKRANRTNPVVLTGELTLVSTSTSRDVFEFYQKSEICPNEEILVQLGVTAGFEAYEWRRNGTIIQGQSSNQLAVTEFGVYDVRFKENGQWNSWSKRAIEIKEKDGTITPDIEISGLNSRVIPAPNGSSTTPLELPEGYIEYGWRLEGTEEIISTDRIFHAPSPGNYEATVTEKFGCSSSFSNSFSVLDANGINKPNAISSFAGFAESKTQIKLQWASNVGSSYPATGFEVYRSLSSAGEYELIHIVDGSQNIYIDESLEPNTEYFYQVRPVNNYSAASSSEEIQVRTQVDDNPPTAPINLRVTGSSSNSITLFWDESQDDVGVYKYEIYKDGVKSLVTEQTSATVYNLVENSSYQFMVKAKDITGNISPFSNLVVSVAVANGVNYKFYNKGWAGSLLPDFNALTPIESGVLPNFDISGRSQNSNYGYLFEGEIKIPVAGEYTFETRSDDGSKLYIGAYDESSVVVDNDGGHGMRYREGTYNFPEAGSYKIFVAFYQGGGGQGLEVYWKNTAHGVTSRERIPDSAFYGEYSLEGNPPNSPSDLTGVSAAYNEVVLSWNDLSNDETGFQIFRADNTSGPFLPIAIAGANETSFMDNDLEGSKTYFYQIASLNEYGASKDAVSSSSSIGAVNSGIAAMDNASGNGYIMFSNEDLFDRFSSNEPHSSNSRHLIAVKYINNQWYYDNNSNLYPFTPVETDVLLAEVDFSSDVISGLQNNSRIINGITSGYTNGDLSFYANRWSGGNNNGEFTIEGTYFEVANPDIAEVTTLPLPDPPFSVANLVGTAVSATEINLTWDNSANADYYEVLRSLDGITFLPNAEILAEESSVLELLDQNLQAHIDYYYRVYSVNAGGRSDSVELEVRTLNSVPDLDDLQESLTIRYDSEYDVNLFGTDADGDQLSISGTNLPSFASLVDYGDGSGLLRFTPSATDTVASPYTEIVISLSDDFGGVSSDTLTLAVNNNHLPTITSLADVVIEEGSTSSVSVEANDIEGNSNLSWENSLPAFATLTVNIDGSGEISLSPGYADHGTYNASITVSDQDGASASTDFVIEVNDKNPNRIVQVNFTDGSLLGGAGWNNTSGHPAQGDTYTELEDISGSASSFVVSISSNWTRNGSNTLGSTTGDNSGVFPDDVMQSAYWTASGTEEVTIGGLDDSKQYELSFFGSRYATNDRSTSYTVGGQSVVLDAASNTSETVSLTASPSGGLLTVEIARAGGSSYGYLNALVIEERYDDGEAPATVRDLSALYNQENSEVELSWSDQAFNELSYHVYRAESIEGAYDLLSTLEAGSTSYSDATVSANQEYYYKIGSSNAVGENLSEAVGIVIPNVAPMITAIADASVSLGASITISVQAEDAVEDIISLSIEGLPAFGSFTDLGSGEGSLTFSPSKGEAGVYSITVVASDGIGESRESFELSVEEEGLHHYYINFAGSTNYSSPSPWNNYLGSGATGSTLTNITSDVAGENILMLSIETGWNGYNTNGEVNTGLYPNNVTSTALWVSSTQERIMTLEGLSNEKAYDFTFYASRSGGGDRTMHYSINAERVSLDASYNVDNTVTIEGVIPNADGTLTISFEKASSASYGYINAIEVKGYQAASIPATPSNLVATSTSTSAIKLDWRDNTNLETAYELMRSENKGSSYSLLATLGSDVTTYTDASSLQAGVTYYYKVRAVLAEGPSEYSNITGASVYNMVSKMNFNAADPAGAPWNNTNNVPEGGALYTDLKDDKNNNTGIAFEVVASNPAYDISLFGFNGDNPFGMNTGTNSGVVPDNVMRSTWWMDQGKTAQLRFYNLDLSQVYQFSFFASRDGNGNRTTVYRVNGKSVKLNAANNVNNIVSLNNLRPDDNGELLVTITTDAGASYSYLGAIIISSSNAIDPGIAMRTRDEGPEKDALELAISQKAQLKIYPNPYSERQGDLQLYLGAVDHQVEITVLNLRGQRVYQRKVEGESTLRKVSLSGLGILKSGVYMMQVKGNQSGIQTIRFMKE